MRYVITLLMLLLVACSDSGRPQPPWNVEPLRLVVGEATTDSNCTLAGRRACYKDGAAYVRPDPPYLKSGIYYLDIPEDWQPPPWPRPSDRHGMGLEMEAGRKLLRANAGKYPEIRPNKMFNRAADIAHEATHHLGFDH